MEILLFITVSLKRVPLLSFGIMKFHERMNRTMIKDITFHMIYHQMKSTLWEDLVRRKEMFDLRYEYSLSISLSFTEIFCILIKASSEPSINRSKIIWNEKSK